MHQSIIVLSKDKNFSTNADHLFTYGAEWCGCDYVGDEYNREAIKNFCERVKELFVGSPISFAQDTIVVSGKKCVWDAWKKKTLDHIADVATRNDDTFYMNLYHIRENTRCGYEGVHTMFYVDEDSEHVERYVDFMLSVEPDTSKGDAPDEVYYITQMFDSKM